MNYVIIVAGGKGMRMGGDIPKQFLPIGGRPVLMRTMERFKAYDETIEIILVLPESQQTYWQELCKKYDFHIVHQIANGGETRFQSSKNGLSLIPNDAVGVVGFHDGVRPFVAIDTIARCYEAALVCGAAIPVMPVTDSLRLIAADGTSKNVLRSSYRAIQTPQVFNIALAQKAFSQDEWEAFTDDASVVEQLGAHIEMVDGNRENIKLTTPFDLQIAATILI